MKNLSLTRQTACHTVYVDIAKWSELNTVSTIAAAMAIAAMERTRVKQEDAVDQLDHIKEFRNMATVDMIGDNKNGVSIQKYCVKTHGVPESQNSTVASVRDFPGLQPIAAEEWELNKKMRKKILDERQNQRQKRFFKKCES